MRQPPTAEQQLQADYFGVGLAEDKPAAENGTGDIYLPPVAPRVSFAPVQWLFREHAYCAWLAENEAAAAQRGALVDLVDATYNRLADEHDLYSADASTEDDVDAAQGAYDTARQALDTFDAAYAEPPVEQAETFDTDEL